MLKFPLLFDILFTVIVARAPNAIWFCHIYLEKQIKKIGNFDHAMQVTCIVFVKLEKCICSICFVIQVLLGYTVVITFLLKLDPLIAHIRSLHVPVCKDCVCVTV